ncbi:MAG: aminotransferase class I/II-fold pyridoxal phosphate-dependent enzyme [Actinobacteria bacterium]|nr:aminotransferase class I/II-fold pyridoxal phosphate-dependent enzyme [Actinomycetota bacterium]
MSATPAVGDGQGHGGFVPPPYPYDRLAPVIAAAQAHDGGAVDCSIGTPCDAPPQIVTDALGASGTERTYPQSIGSAAYRAAASGWLHRRLGVEVPSDQLAACIGTKEFVAGLPHLLKLRRPERDTVLYPAVSYPSYAMGAMLAGCRGVPVAVDENWRIDLSQVDPADAERAMCLWVNTPGNPAGGIDDLAAAAAWGRDRDIPVFSDECYVEFTWAGPRQTILASGLDGVVAVHSLSKRSNLAGARAGFYAGDAALVDYLSEIRKHQGMMVPGPVQAAAIAAWNDDSHVDAQAEVYRLRLRRLIAQLARLGIAADMPDGAFYLWVPAPGGDAWALAQRLAEQVGLVTSPGEFYGAQAAGYIRVAAVQPDAALDLIDARLDALGSDLTGGVGDGVDGAVESGVAP